MFNKKCNLTDLTPPTSFWGPRQLAKTTPNKPPSKKANYFEDKDCGQVKWSSLKPQFGVRRLGWGQSRWRPRMWSVKNVSGEGKKKKCVTKEAKKKFEKELKKKKKFSQKKKFWKKKLKKILKKKLKKIFCGLRIFFSFFGTFSILLSKAAKLEVPDFCQLPLRNSSGLRVFIFLWSNNVNCRANSWGLRSTNLTRREFVAGFRIGFGAFLRSSGIWFGFLCGTKLYFLTTDSLPCITSRIAKSLKNGSLSNSIHIWTKLTSLTTACSFLLSEFQKPTKEEKKISQHESQIRSPHFCDVADIFFFVGTFFLLDSVQNHF